MKSVDGREHAVLQPTEIKLVVLYTVHVAANVVAPPRITCICGAICKVWLEIKALPGAICVTREAEGIAVASKSCIAGEDKRTLFCPARIGVMIVIKRPERIETGRLGLCTLLPVYPPKINALIFERVVKHLKICPHKVGIGNVEWNKLPFLGIFTKSLAHFLILILKESDAL